ncbi:MAG: tetratricopeptide repeat protein, partial [Verrucomicrobiales bacterium]|nr:tetratricopeptide repeat protein [Verrucomicrobiales bacterium]
MPTSARPAVRLFFARRIGFYVILLLILHCSRNEVVAAAENPTPPAPRSAPAGGLDASPAGSDIDPGAATVALKREAIAVAERVAAAYPDEALAAALLGSAYFNTGKSSEALPHLRRCLELNPNLADAYDVLARMAYERGDPEESVRLCREALRRGPGSPELYERLGRALMDLGQTDAAVSGLREATRRPQATGESFYLLGQALLQAGRDAEAKTNLLAALERVPDHTQACFGLLTVSRRLGLEAEARDYQERFRRLEAADRKALADRNSGDEARTGLPLVRKTVARTIFGAAQVHRAHQREEDAGPLFFRAALLDPDPPAYRAALESHFLRLRAPTEGVAAFAKLATEQPTQPWNFLYLGRLHARLQEVEPATRAFRKVQSLAPDWPEGYRALSELYLRSGRNLDEALALARKTVALSPIATHYHLLAAVCAENGDRKAALEAIQQAVTLEPGQSKYRDFRKKLQESP